MSRPVKLAPLLASLRHVRRAAHNADFFGLRISKLPANALKMKYFAELVTGRGSFLFLLLRQVRLMWEVFYGFGEVCQRR